MNPTSACPARTSSLTLSLLTTSSRGRTSGIRTCISPSQRGSRSSATVRLNATTT